MNSALISKHPPLRSLSEFDRAIVFNVLWWRQDIFKAANDTNGKINVPEALLAVMGDVSLSVLLFLD